jgi:hypothetical protein
MAAAAVALSPAASWHGMILESSNVTASHKTASLARHRTAIMMAHSGSAALAHSRSTSMNALCAVAHLPCMQLSLWDLRPLTASPGSSSLQPSATTPIPAGDVQARICYNPDDPSELLTNGKRRAYFWRSQLPGSSLISYYSPPLRAGDFHQEVGDFVASVFVPGTTQVRAACCSSC